MADMYQESYIPILYDSWELLCFDLDNFRQLYIKNKCYYIYDGNKKAINDKLDITFICTLNVFIGHLYFLGSFNQSSKILGVTLYIKSLHNKKINRQAFQSTLLN